MCSSDAVYLKQAERLSGRAVRVSALYSSSVFNTAYPDGTNSPMTETVYAAYTTAIATGELTAPALLAATPTPTPVPTPTPTTPTPTPTPTTPTPTTPVVEAPVPPVVSVSQVIRVDAGRGPHTDLGGRTWARDSGFAGGSVTIAPYEVANTFEDPLYYTRRWGNFTYSLAVPSGSYDVRLHFADPVYTTAGKRKFHVYAENNLVLNRFDVAAYGGGKAAIVRSLIVNVADGSLDLKFQSVVDNAILSAIEVVPRNTAGWTGMTSAPAAITEAQTATVNGRMYVFGGIDATGRVVRTSNIYDPNADTWTRIADLPRPITGGAIAGDGNDIYLVGGTVDDSPGKAPTDNVWKYNATLNTWTAGPALPKALSGAAMARVGRKLRVFGGIDANGVELADHYVFDLDLPELGWRTGTPLPVARHALGAVTLGGKVYAVGGQTGTDRNAGHLAGVQVFNWETSTWASVADLPIARSHIGSSTFVGPGNKIFVVGGMTNTTTGSNALSDVITYDPVAKKWAHREWMPGLRDAPVARFLTNRLIVATGASGPGSPLATVWTHLLTTVTSSPTV